MKEKTLQTCSLEEWKFSIAHDFHLTIEVQHNPYKIPHHRLFSMAARKNLNRRFLFVSKILGKHIPVPPSISLLGGAALAAAHLETVYGKKTALMPAIIEAIIQGKNCEETYQLMKKNPFSLPEPTIFIGFAETATALGHAVFDCFSHGGTYIHTTRERIPEMESLISFEEEHSHATSHRYYSIDENLLKSSNPIVLIDDEITTGKTALNFITAIQEKYPRKDYVVASLLDWRSEEDRQRFRFTASQLGVGIQTVSLISGRIRVEESVNRELAKTRFSTNKKEVLSYEPQVNIQKLYFDDLFSNKLPFSSINALGEKNETPYLLETGRFGITSKDKNTIDEAAKAIGSALGKMRKGKNTLCLGTGEFMYLPMRIAAHMGEGVMYHSTTRSPIFPERKENYAVQNAFSFESPDDPEIINYLYNIPYGYYDDLYLFFERETKLDGLRPLVEVLKKLGIFHLYFVFCLGRKNI
ncbi:hypothetical protein CACET_c32950 [Clostridium aceticum]|uniref:Uncharacterized protein n=1 Tax=Clostridium aceticum TaxID=84022 RepID=A0A0D8IBN6_9CLOT|nr:phosphoribosyltransferase family protein [Clostridium aceticum]AKL96739.1 hypothetical protein CACET_c32950 [Clostridium aceticum]KJF27504.1 hypothetical protein TZ02_06830 [Clostridium aceticum]